MDESLIEKQNGNFANTVLGAVPSVVYNEDCVTALKRYADNHFDLAIVDPPYGLGEKLTERGGAHKNKPFATLYRDSAKWDILPVPEYWSELFRVSKNQIVFGANYFLDYLPNTRGFICWDKKQAMPTFSACELVWTSFDTAVRKVKYRWNGMLQADMKNKEKRIHPTQKPINFYKWIFENYAKKGMKILDTHLGSGSSAIAAHYTGFDFVGTEIDKEYFDKMTKRFNEETIQTSLFLNEKNY